MPLKPLLCFAHRGGRGHGTENALETIKKSLTLGVDAIEIDVWLLGENLVVTHDRRLGRVIRGEGRLQDVDVTKLSELRHYDDSCVPSLLEVLEIVGSKALLNIEIKGPNTVSAVVEVTRKFAKNSGVDLDNYIISSFDHQQLFWLKENAPEFRRGVLVCNIPLDYAACCETIGAYSFHPSIEFIDQALVDDANKRGLAVVVYTVNDTDDFAMLSEMGVAGVFTDYPERVIAFNESLK